MNFNKNIYITFLKRIITLKLYLRKRIHRRDFQLFFKKFLFVENGISMKINKKMFTNIRFLHFTDINSEIY